jgi:hypothetical protein
MDFGKIWAEAEAWQTERDRKERRGTADDALALAKEDRELEEIEHEALEEFHAEQAWRRWLIDTLERATLGVDVPPALLARLLRELGEFMEERLRDAA